MYMVYSMPSASVVYSSQITHLHTCICIENILNVEKDALRTPAPKKISTDTVAGLKYSQIVTYLGQVRLLET